MGLDELYELEHKLNILNYHITIDDGKKLKYLLSEVNKIFCDILYSRCKTKEETEERRYLINYCNAIKCKGIDKRKEVRKYQKS